MEFLRVLCKIFFSVFLRVRVIDADKMPREGGVIVAANHESMLDMFMIGYRVPRYIKWMAKEELFKNKLVAKFITACGAYPVKRSTRDVSAARTTFEMLERGEPVGIFPQGTRAKGSGRAHQAKHGVAKFAVEAACRCFPSQSGEKSACLDAFSSALEIRSFCLRLRKMKNTRRRIIRGCPSRFSIRFIR